MELTWWLALGAGFLSFVSPCVLPVYPSYLSYITGVSVGQLQEKSQPWKLRRATMVHTLYFILGFSVIFYALGFSFSWLGEWFREYQDTIRMLGAIFIFAMGLFMLGVFKPSFLMREKRLQVSKKPLGYLGSFLVGTGFAAGWTPCIGPILSSVLALAAINPGAGLGYITAYNLGFAIPFFVLAFFLGRIQRIYKYTPYLVKIGGILMVVLGILLYFNQMTLIINWLSTLFGGFTGF